MASAPPPKPPRRRPEFRSGRPVLDVNAVAAAALEEVTAGGLARLTIAAVARRLDVTPRALYHYVEDRTALVRLVVRRWLRGAPAIPEGDDLRLALRSFVFLSAAYVVRYPFITDSALVDGVFEYGAEFFAVQEAHIARLVAAGASPKEAVLAFNEVARLVDGLARHCPEAFDGTAAAVWQEMGRAADEGLGVGRLQHYPLSAAGSGVTAAQQVDFAIEVFLDGLFARIPALAS